MSKKNYWSTMAPVVPQLLQKQADDKLDREFKESLIEVREISALAIDVLRRLTTASRVFIENDDDEALAEIEQAQLIAEEFLMGHIDTVKELMERT